MMRICFFGAAGCGKSTTAARLFADLRLREGQQSVIELVSEAIKPWAYMQRPCRSYDGVYIFGQQLHSEDFLFQHGVRHIVTDSPIHVQCFYAKHFKSSFWPELVAIAKKWEAAHQSLNIFLDGGNVKYEETGRYQTKAEAADVATAMRCFLDEHLADYKVFDTTDYESIKSYIFSKVPLE